MIRYACVLALAAQSALACRSRDHGIEAARRRDWPAFPFDRGRPQPRGRRTRDLDAAGLVYAGAAATNARDDGRSGTIRVVSGGAEGRCRAGSLSHPHRIVRHLQRPALHPGDVSGSDRRGIAAQLAPPSQRHHRDRRTGAIGSGGGQRHAPRSGARCLPRVRQSRRTACVRVGSPALRIRHRPGAADSGRVRQTTRAQRRRARRRPRRAAGFHLPLRRQLLRRGHRRTLQHAGAEFLPPQNGRLPLRRRHLPAGRTARGTRARDVLRRQSGRGGGVHRGPERGR